MAQITRDSLLPLEVYARARPAFRARVMQHKHSRRVQLDAHLTLVFEDELTIRYQIQEMLRVERIFEEDGIRHELDTYNSLVPDGTNWKATMMLEFPDPELRREQLGLLLGIEDSIWVQVDGFDRAQAIADEDLERANSEKTSAVHFLRFELSAAMRAALAGGAAVSIIVEHPQYRATCSMPPAVRESLARDLA